MTIQKQEDLSLQKRSHRPYPIPNRPWVMHQTWNDVLFAHWPIPIDEIQAIVPDSLTVDTFDGHAWIGIVPFWTSGVRPRFLPTVPFLSPLPEINLRTYVTINGKPGVYFFSLDTDQKIVVEAARHFLYLSYFRTKIDYIVQGNHNVHYHSIRNDSRANSGEFKAAYRPVGAEYLSVPGSLDHWLTERYCMYSVDTKGRIFRSEIDHSPWPLQQAEAEIEINTLLSSFGLQQPPIQPLLHFAKKLHVHAWLLKSCSE